MESLYLLIPVALVFVVIAVKVLFWAVNSGQYDDLETEAHRILFDEDLPSSAGKSAAEDTQQSAPSVQKDKLNEQNRDSQ